MIALMSGYFDGLNDCKPLDIVFKNDLAFSILVVTKR